MDFYLSLQENKNRFCVKSVLIFGIICTLNFSGDKPYKIHDNGEDVYTFISSYFMNNKLTLNICMLILYYTNW